jgi:hypothetical protein
VKRGRIRLYFEGEERDLAASAKRAEQAIGGVDDATQRYNVTADQQAVAVERVNQRNFQLATSTSKVSRESDTLTKRLQDVNIRFTSMRNLVSLIKWPALITGAGYAAQGLGAAAVGATSLTSALAPLSGALAAYPALLGAVGQAAGVLALTQMDDLKEALGGNEEALKKLTPEAREFTGVFKDFEKPFKAMRTDVQAKLFGGLSRGMRDAGKNFGVVDRVMQRTAGTMGKLAERAGALLGSKGFGRDLQTIGEGNARVLGRMGVAGIKLGSALRHVMVAAQPFLGWLSGTAVKLADWVDGAAKAGRESGRMGAFFDRTRQTMERLGSIVQSLASGFFQIGKAAAPLGRQILASFDRSAQSFEDWTESMKGRNTLREYFADAKPTIFEFGRLIRDAGGAFLRLSNDKGVFTLTRAVRTQLLPVLEELVTTTTRELGPRFVNLLVQVGKMFGTFAGNSGPLTLFLDQLTRMLRVTNHLLDTVPGLKTFAVTMVGIAAVSKAMKFTAAITGVKTLIDLFGRLRTSALGAAAAQQAAGAGAPVGGLRGRAGRMLGRVQAGAGVAVGGVVAGSMVGGRGGGVLAGAGAGAGIGMMAGPLGAVIGGLAGALAGAVTTSGSSMGDQLATSFAQSFDQNLAPKIGRAIDRKNVGKLERLRANVGKALSLAIAEGADDASLKPLRDRFRGLSKGLADALAPREVVADNVDKLRSGLITRMKDINTLFRQNAGSIAQGWRHGSEGWRNATESSMRSVVQAIRSGMRDGTINADAGIKRIKDLLRNVRLIQGTDPLGIAKGFADSWRRTGEINQRQVARVKQDLGKMPKDAREAAQDAMVHMAQALENKGHLVKGSASRLQSALLTKFDRTNDSLVKSFGRGVKGIAGLFDDLGGAIATALQSIGVNINGVLRALGVTKTVNFTVKVGKSAVNALGSAAGNVVDLFRADGGWVSAPSRRDSVIAALGRDEAVLNVHQQPEVERGLLLQKVLGFGQHGSLNELFAGVRRPNHLATGGYADKVPRPRITGPAPLSTMGQNGVDRAWHGAVRYLRKHARAIMPGSVVAVGRQLLGMGYEVGEHPAFGGVAGVHTKGSDHYINRAIDVNDDVAPYGHGHSEMQSLDWLARMLKRIPHKQIIWRNRDLDTGAPIPGHTDHLHFAAALGGFARRVLGKVVGFASGGRVQWSSLVGSSWDNDELATLAHLVGMPNPGLMAQIARGESRGNPKAVGHDEGGTEGLGLWQITTDYNDDVITRFGGRSAMFNPWRNALAAKAILDRQGIGAWYAPPTGAKGRVDSALAQKIRAAMSGKTIGGDGAGTKARDYTFGLGQREGVNLPGLKPGALPSQAQGLPAAVQGLLRQPGLSLGQKLQIGEFASTMASNTAEPLFDAEGNEISADSHADDIAAAKFLKALVKPQKRQWEQQLKRINGQLRKGGESEKGRKRLLAKRNRLLGNVTGARERLRELNETINAGPEDPAEAPPTARDFASRDLALAELTADGADDRAALERLQQIAEEELRVAQTTANPRDDIEAAQNVKSIRETLEATNEILRQREEFERERLEVDKRFLALAETQGPAFMAAWTAYIDGQIGGPTGRRMALPATPGVAAGYQ